MLAAELLKNHLNISPFRRYGKRAFTGVAPRMEIGQLTRGNLPVDA